ncbi:MAG TPA: transcriptional regulator [Flavobacteriaceae bacterium]|nr:transcriptional regulator [Flavobacteriaceae bacterium]MAY52186.1 transcriptional regulator [Flavobacteriaceae bacterium]HBR53771.1 transcriptional regulator [Flavobacteriaceae bacterium]|tara:strand:- start:90552 stop:90989 length:438 start_codon:yes stop_codon:yes gene_type:complete
MVNSADFTIRLEKILAFYGLTATAFSEEIDFNRSTISHLLSGRNKPSLEFVMKVVQTFEEVDLYWLLNGKGTFPSTASTTETISTPVTTSAIDTPETKTRPFPKETIETTESDSSPPPSSPSHASKAIDRIVIFYKDGSFKEYLP